MQIVPLEGIIGTEAVYIYRRMYRRNARNVSLKLLGPPPKNSFSRFSIPIIEACCCSQEEETESFLNYPVKTKGNRCGYRLVRLRLQIRYRLPRDKILSSLFRLNQIGYKLFDRFISK